MAAQASWVGEAPAVNDSVSVEIEDTVLTTIGLDRDELSGSGLPRIVGNSDALRQVLGMVRIVAPGRATLASSDGRVSTLETRRASPNTRTRVSSASNGVPGSRHIVAP
jgi:hypothetical protein